MSIPIYPADERQECGYGIQFIKWITGSGVAMEIGPDAFSVIVAVVAQEDAIHYQRPVNFYNEQLAQRCGIQSTHALIRARQRAIDAGLLCYTPGAKRTPGTYWVTGFSAQSASNQDGFTAQSASKAKRNRRQNAECTAQSASNPQTSIPIPYTHTQSIGDTKTKRFIPPSVADVAQYASEIDSNVDPERFVDFYAANGWKVGKSPMKDWKACFRNWNRTAKHPSDDRPELKPMAVLA